MIEVPIALLVILVLFIAAQFAIYEYFYHQMSGIADRALEGWDRAIKGWVESREIHRQDRETYVGSNKTTDWPDTIEKQ
jgi:quinol-cytochrome oxidoreductase complex cytochrome b subunit